MEYSTIEYFKEDNIGIIRLNRPHRMNAVIEEMYMEIQQALKAAESDNTVRAVILTGSVLKKNGVVKQAFCAGADLKKHAEGDRTEAQKRKYIMLAQYATKALYEFPKPTIAAVNGPARGAGVEMALNCDFVFMADDATMALTETGLGTFIGGAVTYNLVRMVGLQTAKEIVYAGTLIDGKKAVDLGLALRTYPIEELLTEAKAFARTLAARAPVSLQLAKKRLQQMYGFDHETVLLLEADAIFTCMNTEDWHEGIRAFKERRAPVFKGV
ncbi:MAG: enoyl-CoA hydratase/isomerase family protein [Deltaproteobacteria bacterium]|nr:enoyl-CoA hydratase/isomerase family protein [Deltaproteobacteria bacterium]